MRKHIKLFETFDAVNEDEAYIPNAIKTTRDAETFLVKLAHNGQWYHFDDNPKDVLNASGPAFTAEEARIYKDRMDQVFDVCDKHYGKKNGAGLWEGLIKNVFVDYVAFTADEEPATADVYIVKGGGPDIRKTTQADYDKMNEECYSEDNGYDENKVDAWFNTLKKLPPDKK